MSALADRLRAVVKPGGPEGPPLQPRLSTHDSAADVLDGEWRESRGQRYLVIDRTYPPGYRHGDVALADVLPPIDDVWARLSLLAGPPSRTSGRATRQAALARRSAQRTDPARHTACGGRMLFLDLETTGLAGGAGTYAFLVGCAWFGGGVFRIRQFFLSSFAAERVLLDAVAETADEAGTVVTYNGKSFDLPLLDTRFVMHRMETPFAGMPHVDMLHSARRLWRDDVEEPGRRSLGEGGCRLSALEETQCGHRREGDVPGVEIPSRYFQFVRSGDARGLEAVMEHNRLDLLSLALLTARASQLLDEGPAAARTAREALGIGRLYERAGLHPQACAAFDRAAHIAAADPVTRAEALRAYGVSCRRQRRYADAAGAWRQLLDLPGCPAQIVREATEALAVHHEHRLRDPRAARTFAMRSMQFQPSVAGRQSLEYRLARLNRKVEAAESAALF